MIEIGNKRFAKKHLFVGGISAGLLVLGAAIVIWGVEGVFNTITGRENDW